MLPGSRLPCALIVLAGGGSTRMGMDKAHLPWSWRRLPLYRIQLDKADRLGPERVPALLSGREGQTYPELPDGVRLVHDAPDLAGQGPLAGLVSCLEACAESWVAVLAIDTPLIPGDYLADLLEEAQQSGKSVVPRDGEKWEPLAAVYHRETLLEAARNQLAAGRRDLQSLARAGAAAGWLIARTVAPMERWMFANLNTLLEVKEQERFASSATAVRVTRHSFEGTEDPGSSTTAFDSVATEEPLEIRVQGRSIALTMRTPGHDEELAAGFLFTEGLLNTPEDLEEIVQCPALEQGSEGNVVDVKLRPGLAVDFESLTRHVFTSSSCGLCGKATIAAICGRIPRLTGGPQVSPGLLRSLPAKLREAQATFGITGGLHASALFSAAGDLLIVREDVGRHNALDKVIGRSLLDDKLPLTAGMLLVSGRLSFELTQKAHLAGLTIVAGISAPSSLAVAHAQDSGQTLVGFLRDRYFNVYAGAHRLVREE